VFAADPIFPERFLEAAEELEDAIEKKALIDLELGQQ